MPRPSSKPAWTQGNPSAQTQPTNGEKFGGYSPNQRPDPKKWNWLIGNLSDWVDWFDSWGTGGSMPVSNVSHNIMTGTTLQQQLDECDAFLSSLGFQVLTLVVTGNPAIFTVTPIPFNGSAPLVFLNGIDETPTTDFTFAITGGVARITFTAPPAAGQTPVAIGLTGNNPGPGGGAMTGGYIVYGTYTSGIVVTAGGGVSSTLDQRAIIFTVSAGGAVPITSNPRISAGTKIGQELRLVGTSDTNYISLADGNGLFLNGPIALKNNVSIDLWWTGAGWAESDRKN